MRRGIVCTLVMLGLVLGGVGPQIAAAAEDGKAVYQKRCATCHGDAGEGKAAIAKAMKVEFKHLGSKEVQEMANDQIAKTINEGKGKMKAVKLSPDELKAVIAFVKTLKP